MKTITLARKPFDGTVAHNMLTHGCGGLNINTCRITLEPNSRLIKGGSYSGNRTGSNASSMFNGGNGKVEYTPPPGRWPANLILQHLEGCRRDGVKKVKPSNGSGRAGAGASGFQTSYVGGDSKATGFTGGSVEEDGKETVANWICEDGCPVKALDEQSGVSKSSGGRTANISTTSTIYGGGKGLGQDLTADSVRGDPGFGDTGGASRFYKQVVR